MSPGTIRLYVRKNQQSTYQQTNNTLIVVVRESCFWDFHHFNTITNGIGDLHLISASFFVSIHRSVRKNSYNSLRASGV